MTLLEMKPIRIHCQSILMYANRLLAIELLAICLIVIGPLYLLDHIQTPDIVFFVAVALSVLLGVYITLTPVIKRRPYITLDENAIHIVVAPFFNNKTIKNLYAINGYGSDFLPHAINYLGPKDILWEDIKYFRINKRYLSYRVIAVLHQRRHHFICARYKRQNAQQIKEYLESLKTTAVK